MSTRVSILDFSFRFIGYGRYKVIYTSPKTYKQWSTYISDMTVIDSTLNADEPKQKDLQNLKRFCKNK